MVITIKNDKMSTTTLYRYQKTCYEEYIVVDGLSNVRVYLMEYDVIRETEHFYVFREHGNYGKEKRTSKTARSRFAFPTKMEALENFISRTKSSIDISLHQIKYSQLAIIEAQKIINEINTTTRNEQDQQAHI